MPGIEDQIRSKTMAFAERLTALFRKAALEAATAALGASVPVASRERRPGLRRTAPSTRRARAASRAAAASPSKAAVSTRKPAKRARSEKRPPAELATLVDKLGTYINANPGQRMEAIGKALGVPTRELNLPVKKLLAAKRIRAEGQKRATEYFPT
jgi:hypothetical protein